MTNLQIPFITRNCKLLIDLWAYMDSNHGPRPYQGRALAN